jgi:hypothetical protein
LVHRAGKDGKGAQVNAVKEEEIWSGQAFQTAPGGVLGIGGDPWANLAISVFFSG